MAIASSSAKMYGGQLSGCRVSIARIHAEHRHENVRKDDWQGLLAAFTLGILQGHRVANRFYRRPSQEKLRRSPVPVR